MKTLKDFKEAADTVPVRVYDTKTETWYDVVNVFIDDNVMVVEI